MHKLTKLFSALFSIKISCSKKIGAYVSVRIGMREWLIESRYSPVIAEVLLSYVFPIGDFVIKQVGYQK